MSRLARRSAAVCAMLALCAAPTAAQATDGALYASGSSIWSVRPGVGASVQPGPTWLVQAPAMNPAIPGNFWEMNWGCPVGGSEIAAVQFGALRTQGASSLAVAVTGDRHTLWAEGDAGMPQSPQGGRSYHVNLPGGQCNVHLALVQVEQRFQNPRGWFIDNPRILVRDLTAPAVGLRHVDPGWLNSGTAETRVAWGAADNFGSDGIALQRISIAGQPRWEGLPGAGEHEVRLPLGGTGDGRHAVRVDVYGDGTDLASAEGVLHVDRTPPVAGGLSATATATSDSALRWTVSDNVSGAAQSTVEVNAAGDGSASGAWEPLATANGPGPHSSVARVGVPDGVHAWRVIAKDIAGNSAAIAGPDRILVDTTPPSLDLHDVPSGWVRNLDLDLTATDNLQAAVGLGATQVEVNAAADGSEGAWTARSSAVLPAGRRVVPVDLAGLADGPHLMRVTVRNGGVFGQRLAAQRQATVRVDRTPPSISRLAFAAGRGTITAAWTADDERAGVETVTVQWRDGARWRTLSSGQASNGSGRLAVDATSVPLGERTFRVMVGDAAGNLAARDGTLLVTRAGVGSTATDPFARLRKARLSLSPAGARPGRIGGRRALVVRVRTGERVVIKGRLRDHRGRAIARTQIEARGHRGAVVGRTTTGPRGGFRLVATPRAGAPLSVGVPAGSELLPARRGPVVVLEVAPKIRLAASTRTTGPGQQVLFTGRIFPAPSDIGLGSRKGIVLQWRDPVRRTWRPVVNARIRADGTFAIPWSFNLSGYTIPMRVTVPTEVGWPLLPVRSGVIAVAVR